MKKKFISILSIIALVLSFTACTSEKTDVPNTDTSVPDEAYVIEDLLFEKNLDELKKQYPNYVLNESDAGATLIIEDKCGELNGNYKYSIESNKIFASKFDSTVSFYKDIDILIGAETIPVADNIDALNKALDETYNILFTKYGMNNVTVRKTTESSGLKELGSINSKEEFDAIVEPMLIGGTSDYLSVVFSGYIGGGAHFISVNIHNERMELRIEVEVIQ